MANQWPEFDKLPQSRTVRSVLLEEGSGVSERTGGDIRFAVESEPSGQGFVHHCYLDVPKVGYRYPLLRVRQEGLDYPVVVFTDGWPQGAAAGNEAGLRENLGLVFRSDTVKKLVPQLRELVS